MLGVAEAGRGRVYYQAPGGAVGLGEATELPYELPLVGWLSERAECGLRSAGLRLLEEGELLSFGSSAHCGAERLMRVHGQWRVLCNHHRAARVVHESQRLVHETLRTHLGGGGQKRARRLHPQPGCALVEGAELAGVVPLREVGQLVHHRIRPELDDRFAQRRRIKRVDHDRSNA